MNITREQYEKALQTVIDYRKQVVLDISNINDIGVIDKEDLLYESNLSVSIVRGILGIHDSENNLDNYESRKTFKIKDLDGFSRKRLLKIYRLGKIYSKELFDFCDKAGIVLSD